ncbi:MAG: hypothetical protein F4X08_06920 [Gemmatimonadetes bacterium]|nr:hypothetical protein [Gemmatimonadota bacterium]
MGTPQLGTLESIDVRQAWKHEAHEFTPWLTKNLDLLSNVLGIEMEYIDSEVYVQGFRADIIARDLRDGSQILIENQLENANLQHLGQVLAYLAGLDATVVVWIAKQFNAIHRSAIRWLNDHTSDPFRFFAVELKVVRIGDSPLAPVFDVLEKPNEWDRSVKDTAHRTELSELGQFRREFWNFVASKYPGEVRPDHADSNVYHQVDGIELRISQCLYRKGVGVFLVVTSFSDPELPFLVKPYLEPLDLALQLNRSEEETEISTRGEVYLRTNPRERSNWGRMAEWLHDRRLVYERVLRETKVD